MPKKRRATKQDVLEFLRLGGTKVPADFSARAVAATKTLRQREFDPGKTVRAQGAKMFSGLSGASAVDLDDPANAKSLDGLLNWQRKLAARKLPFPKVPKQVGGFFPGRISGTIVPPFDFADTIPTVISGHTALSVSANVNGKIGGTAVTEETAYNGGSEYARVGFFFHPMSQGTLTISASPAYSYGWVTNSLNSSDVTSSGGVGLTIYGMTETGQIPSSAGVNYKLWNEMTTGQIKLDFGSNLQHSMSASLPVTHSLIYLCFVEIFVHVLGAGWPGSLATAMASATVPSISYEFDPLIVAQS